MPQSLNEDTCNTTAQKAKLQNMGKKDFFSLSNDQTNLETNSNSFSDYVLHRQTPSLFVLKRKYLTNKIALQ